MWYDRNNYNYCFTDRENVTIAFRTWKSAQAAVLNSREVALTVRRAQRFLMCQPALHTLPPGCYYWWA